MRRYWLDFAVPLAVTVAVAAVAFYLTAWATPAPTPATLLGAHPAFSSGMVELARAGASFTGWRTTGTGQGSVINGTGAYQTVCAYRFRTVARLTYIWESLLSVGGEDWPNFESWSDTTASPKDAASLHPHADEWEIGCGLGDPDGLCRAWVYRGRYGRVLTAIEVDADVGMPGDGIPFEAVRVFVRSLDSELAAKLRDA